MTQPIDPARAKDVCHCGHTEDQHDAVAARYCRATLSEALPRTCTCQLSPPDRARSYDRR